MESVPYHSILAVSEKNVEIVRRDLNLDVNTIKKNLEVIEEWAKKQDHLAEGFRYIILKYVIQNKVQRLEENNNLHGDILLSVVSLSVLIFQGRNMLELLHLLGKGSVEMTKTRIDKLLTTRGMLPDICLNRSVEEFTNISESINFVILPKQSPMDQSRIIVTQIRNMDNFSLIAFIRYASMIAEYRMNFEYNTCERHILDLKNVTSVSVLTKLNPFLLKKAEILCMAGYGMRISGIHLLNAPPFVDKIVYLLKQGLKDKVANRLMVHSSYEELHKEIPKEILPEDFGGDMQSCSKLEEQWKNVLKTEEAQKLIASGNKLVADESKRSSFKFNEEYMGMPGSFRQLVVD